MIIHNCAALVITQKVNPRRVSNEEALNVSELKSHTPPQLEQLEVMK